MVSILVALPFLVVIVIVFLVAGAKGGKVQGGGEDLIKNVYIYLVLFATLMMTIGGSVGIFMAAADIIAPVPYHQSFEEFKRWGVAEKDGVVTNNLSDDELRQKYDAMVLAEKERRVSRAKNSLVKSLGWIVIPLPVFIYFQRHLGRDQAKNHGE